jgi:hypothetical protein
LLYTLSLHDALPICQDPSKLSAVFDEVTIKERLLVEGGSSGQVLSQFDGPVNFNGDLRIKALSTFSNSVRLTRGTQSTSSNTGDLIVSGGVGIGNNLNVGGTLGVTGATTLSSTLTVTGNTTLTGILTINGGGGGTALRLNSGGDIVLYNAANTGSATLFCDTNGELRTNDSVLIGGALNVVGDITAFYTSDQRLKDNIVAIEDPLTKVLSISGNTYTWNEKSGKEGNDVGVIAQEILEVLPEAVTTRDNGYLAVDYHKIVPLLVEAIKELSAKVENLEQKLTDK